MINEVVQFLEHLTDKKYRTIHKNSNNKYVLVVPLGLEEAVRGFTLSIQAEFSIIPAELIVSPIKKTFNTSRVSVIYPVELG